jgi:hypothetical protein
MKFVWLCYFDMFLPCLGHARERQIFRKIAQIHLSIVQWLIHALPTRGGGEFELEMACWMHLEGFQVVLSNFWALMCTGLTGRGHRSDRSQGWSCAHVEHRSDRWW